MACPLSVVLNAQDESPRITRRTANSVSDTQYSKDDRPPTDNLTSTVPGSPYADQNRSAFQYSPEKGRLYNKRKQRRLEHSPSLLPSPPRAHLSDLCNDWGPPSPEMFSEEFSIFNAFLQYTELTFEMIKYLDPSDLLTLYSVSRDFHALADTRFTTMILSQSDIKAPESSRIFPFRCYRSLCIRDPMQRPNTAKKDLEVRYVPGFKWLHMVLFRERMVDDIVACLEQESLMLPQATTITIKRIWFTMDLPTNNLRGKLIRNRSYWTDQELYLATLFIMKLDMLFTCPVIGEGDLGLRKMLLGQRSLATLARVMKRDQMRDQYEMLKMILLWDYVPTPQQRQFDQPIMGVKVEDMGKLRWEGWGANPGVPFWQVDSLVTIESVRRGLDMPAHYLDMVFYGFVDMASGLDIWTATQKKRMQAARKKERADNKSHEGDDVSRQEVQGGGANEVGGEAEV
ncbi:MAG: hypothetical protein Q9219_007585 [cf. Caloplaca sp. 3 TL-2023]